LKNELDKWKDEKLRYQEFHHPKSKIQNGITCRGGVSPPSKNQKIFLFMAKSV
jgi:hypothetical protein